MKKHPPKIHRAARGFTLIELLVASLLSLMLFAVMLKTLQDALLLAEIMQTRVALNQEAREAYRISVLGGGVDNDASGGLDDTEVLRGLHGSASANLDPTGDTLQKTNQRLQLTDGALSIFGTELNVDLTCIDLGALHPDCLAGTVNMDGYLTGLTAPAAVSSPVPAITRCNAANGDFLASVSWTFMDPRRLALDEATINIHYQATYRTIASLHVDCLS